MATRSHIADLWGRLRSQKGRGRFRPLTTDLVLVAILLLLDFGSFVVIAIDDISILEDGIPAPDTISVTLFVVGTLIATVPLLARRMFPVAVFLITLVGAIVIGLGVDPEAAPGLGPLVALGTVAALRPLPLSLRLALIPVALTLAWSVWDRGIGDFRGVTGDVFSVVIIAAAAIGIGYAVAQRRSSEKAKLAEAELRGRQAVVEERARIARELHDVVAHGLSVMTVQAGAARVAVDREPDAARASLDAIQQTGRDSMNEMRRLLGVLRGEDEEAADRPQPGVDDLDELIARSRGAGLPVEYTTEGASYALPTGLALTVYRVVQEGLTNAIKHAGSATARVVLRYGSDTIEVEVVDDGRGGEPHAGGHGLVGMRERVALFGGSLEAGPVADGGFRILARLPTEGGS